MIALQLAPLADSVIALERQAESAVSRIGSTRSFGGMTPKDNALQSWRAIIADCDKALEIAVSEGDRGWFERKKAAAQENVAKFTL